MYYDYETSNKSFTDLVEKMKKRGHNVEFILQLNDKDLVHVDPFNPTLDEVMQNKIINEVERNFWYFAREVARIPTFEKGVTRPVTAHRGNIALWSIMQHGFNVYSELPRQLGNTMNTAVFVTWKNICETKFITSCVSDSPNNAMHNINRMQKLYNILPNYFIDIAGYMTSHNPTQATLVEKGNTVYVDYLDSEHVSPGAIRVEAERNESNIKWIDHFTYLAYNDLILDIYLTDCHHKSTRQVVLTSSIGFDNDRRDVAAQRLIMGSLKFDESMYDMTIHQLQKELEKYPSQMIYITFNPLEMDMDEKYILEQIPAMCGDLYSIMKEIFMQRPSHSLINSVKHMKEKGVPDHVIEKVIARYVEDMTVKYDD